MAAVYRRTGVWSTPTLARDSLPACGPPRSSTCAASAIAVARMQANGTRTARLLNYCCCPHYDILLDQSPSTCGRLLLSRRACISRGHEQRNVIVNNSLGIALLRKPQLVLPLRLVRDPGREYVAVQKEGKTIKIKNHDPSIHHRHQPTQLSRTAARPFPPNASVSLHTSLYAHHSTQFEHGQ